MSMIKGITVILHGTEYGTTNPFGEEVDEAYIDTDTDAIIESDNREWLAAGAGVELVDNVLVAPASNSEILDATNLYGKKAVYTLAIPKGDTHEWENRIVEFFGKRWRVFGIPTKGIEANVPLDWNKKVTVELYE